jgi:molybdopterin-guanine dinucleotide biosynthesis protein A
LQHEQYEIPAILLAGGKSSRMGQDKALLPFKEEASLTHYQYKKLSTLFSNVYISTKDSKFDFEANLLFDTYNESSPLVALLSAFETLQPKMLFVLSVDIPFITPEIIKKLITLHSKAFDATIAKTPHGLEPLCGLYNHTIYPKAKHQFEADNHKLTHLLNHSKTQTIHFDNTAPFLNLNTPELYEEALKQI